MVNEYNRFVRRVGDKTNLLDERGNTMASYTPGNMEPMRKAYSALVVASEAGMELGIGPGKHMQGLGFLLNDGFPFLSGKDLELVRQQAEITDKVNGSKKQSTNLKIRMLEAAVNGLDYQGKALQESRELLRRAAA